jgi:hypothetical protein
MSGARSLLLLVALTLGLALPGTASAAAPAAKHGAVVSALASGGYTVLPLRGAKLRVLHGGETVARGRLGSRGVAILSTRRRVPGSLRVVVSGGRIGKHRFDAKLSGRISGYRWPQPIHVDIVTTLIDRYARSHPHLSTAAAARRVKRFLVLPRTYAPGADGRANVDFDGRRFLEASGTGAHFDRFLAHLEHRIDISGAHRSFRHIWSGPVGAAKAAKLPGAAPQSGLEKLAGQITGAKGIFKLLTSSGSISSFTKAVLGLTGNSPKSKVQAELEKIEAQLQQVEESLGVVKALVEELQKEGQQDNYDRAVEGILAERNAASVAEELLHAATEISIQYHCSTGEAVESQCPKVAALLTGPGGVVSQIQRGGLGDFGAVKTYVEQIGGSALVKAQTPPRYRGIIQDASELVVESRPFFTASESNQLRTIAAYWIASATQTTAAAAAAWALEGDSETALEVAAKSIAEYTQSLPGTLPEAVPPHVTLNMATGTMWPTSVSMYDSGLAWILPGFSAEWKLNAASERWEANFEEDGETVWEPVYFGPHSGPLAYEDWKIAGEAQINAQLESVSPEPGETSGETVLEKGGIEIEAVAPRWGREENRGLEMEYVKAWDGPEGCRKPSASSCYWPIAIAVGPEAGAITVANMHEVASTYGYRSTTFQVSDPLNFEWYGKELWGYAHNGYIYGNLDPSNIPMLLYRKVPKSSCFYFPSVSQPSAGSPGCPG